MAHSDVLTVADVEAVSKQVRQLILEGVHDEPAWKAQQPADTSARDSCKIGDSLQVWSLDREAVEGYAKNGLDLDKIARPTGQWQHLLKVNGKSKSLVRSSKAEDQSSPIVSQVQTTPLAGSISDAISCVEKEGNDNPGFRERVGNDPLVRWLSVPFYRVYGLWLINESSDENFVIVVESPTQSLKLRTRELLTSREFLEALPRAQKSFSIS